MMHTHIDDIIFITALN